MALLGCREMLFFAEKEGSERGEINKNAGADFKLQLCSSYICIWSPASPTQIQTWCLGFLAWPWSCRTARDLLGCVGHGAAALEPILTCCPASWLRAPACLAITMAPCPQWSHRPSLHPLAFGVYLLSLHVNRHLKFSQIFLKYCYCKQSKPREGVSGSRCDTAVSALLHD